MSQPLSDLALRARRKEIDDAVMRVFRRREFCALYVAGPTHPVARSFGDNQGGWPIKIGVTRAAEDTISATLDGASPLWEQRVLFRVWVETWARVRKLEKLVLQAVSASADDLRKNWRDMGADFQREFFELEIHSIGQANGISTWDDDDLLYECARDVKRDMAKRVRA